ncbi:hypothetical protein GCM10011324_02130 [Allosediminivita pacifica]|uniref:Uncharacterized protein n=1 Tax=Allosediminivita pacifica TaxID=1267769 RepID=A0A2T6B9T1_9RHOB|nr:hypothetical protein C8N44_101131 [Allosediminivita pacifica]GGA95412.1 hypothetical protein GCM10011324_02130 [Allosediminivita pacifica]
MTRLPVLTLSLLLAGNTSGVNRPQAGRGQSPLGRDAEGSPAPRRRAKARRNLSETAQTGAQT